jgi:hypothetical protein
MQGRIAEFKNIKISNEDAPFNSRQTAKRQFGAGLKYD